MKEFKSKQDEDMNISQKQSPREDLIRVDFNEYNEKKSIEIDLTHLNKEKTIKIKQLIEEYKTMFSIDWFKIRVMNNYEARIDL